MTTQREYYARRQRRRGLVTAVVIVAVIGVIVIIAGGYGALVDSTYGIKAATQYVEQSGYKNVRSTGRDLWFVTFSGCARDDAVAYHFTATALNGQRVSVTVCKGLLKGATLRQGG